MTDSKVIATLQARIVELGDLTENQQYAKFIYITKNSSEDVAPRVYLPDVIKAAMRSADEDAEYADFFRFEAVWGIFADHGYVNLTDGSDINVLDVAAVWLGVGMEEKTGLFNSFALEIGQSTAMELLHNLIDTEIKPILSLEASTNIIFTKINMINAAFQLFAEIASGLVYQNRLYKTLTILNKEFTNVVPLPAYDDTLETVTYLFELRKKDGSPINFIPTIDVDIWDSVMCSPVLPVCIRNGDEKKTGKGVFKSVDDRMIKIFNRDENELSRLHKEGFFADSRSLSVVMYVYIGDDEKKAGNAPIADFARVIYSFKKGIPGYHKFTVTLNKSDTSNLLKRLNAHMSAFSIAQPVETSDQMISLKQHFVIPGLAIDKDILMFCASTDVSNSLLKFVERDSPFTQKKVLQFSILLFGSVTMVIKPEVIENSTMLVMNKGNLTTLMKGDYIVKVTVASQNLEQHELARFIAVRFLSNYAKKYDANYRLFSAVTERERLEPIVPIQVSVDNSTLRNVKQLRVADPELWGFSNYTRVAAPNVQLQVKPIKANEIETYKAKGRQVILWPVKVHGVPENMQTTPSINPATGKPLQNYYTTMTDENPYIVLIPNQGPNSATHPLIPKCQKTASDIVVNADWTITVPEKEKGGARGKKKTLRPLSPGEHGNVSGSITQYLGTNNIVRYGLWKSPSSFLHAILMATSQPGEGYRTRHTTPEAEETAIEVRRMLSDFASCCLQENPNKTVDQIRDELYDPEVYLDPRLYYRACEEMFGVNIFIAAPDSNKEILIEPPNFESYYTRTKRRPLIGSIVVVRLPVPHVKNDAIFQCEVLGSVAGQVGFVFDDKITTMLEDATNKIARSLKIRPSCSIETSDQGVSMIRTISVEDSLGKEVLPPTLLSKIEAQKVDNLGKCRAVKVRLSKEVAVWIVTPPIEPLSGPNYGDYYTHPELERVATSIPLGEIVELKDEHRAFVVSNLFSDQKILFTPADGNLVGFWSQLHGMEVYVPLKPTSWLQSYQPVRYSVGYHFEHQESPTEKLRRLQRVVTITIQIMKRLFVLSGLSAEEFSQQYMKVGVPVQKMTTSGGVRLIPLEVMADFDGLLNHFMSYFPSLFQDGKILCDSQDYFNNLKRRLVHYEFSIERERQTNLKDDGVDEGTTDALTKFPPYLFDFYATLEDYTVHNEKQLIFLSTARLELERKAQEESKLKTYKKIDSTLVGKTSPYVYMYNDKKKVSLFLVQNVEGGDISRAATVAAYWAQNRINLGYYCPPIIGNTGIKTIEASSIQIEDPFEPMIVLYGTGEAAALLSLNEK